jgi:hypothetical protein
MAQGRPQAVGVIINSFSAPMAVILVADAAVAA